MKSLQAIRAVLLDLDNTLLPYQHDRYYQGYFELIRQHLLPYPDGDRAVAAVMRSHRDVHFLDDQSGTVDDKLWALFARHLEADATPWRERIGAFYASGYLRLETLVSPARTAPLLCERLLMRGITLVIATDPVYPAAAIHHRMRWAGLGPLIDRFALITSDDSVHTTKPHCSYYGEILASLDLASQETLMVGDDMEKDIAPARQCGMHTYHVRNDAGRGAAQESADAGSLESLLARFGTA